MMMESLLHLAEACSIDGCPNDFFHFSSSLTFLTCLISSRHIQAEEFVVRTLYSQDFSMAHSPEPTTPSGSNDAPSQQPTNVSTNSASASSIDLASQLPTSGCHKHD
mmetsp:Transcript_18285/g.45318  ORF Transcript_18285/g.45318 Transcript_18285/m.45318 type:complete len:107 (-) Transcript_18285:731-1051(-)